jgi:DNA polymerase-3 subunit beta
LSNILVESVGENTIRFTGTDLDVTVRCDAEAENIITPGAVCVQARKLFDIARLLPPDATVHFKQGENDWATVTAARSNFKVAGVAKEHFPEVPSSKSVPIKLPAFVFKSFIDRTIFAITQEESRYTLSGAKFMLDAGGAKMVTTDGHRLAYIGWAGINGNGNGNTGTMDTLIPRKTLAELSKLAASYEGDIMLGADDNHIYFEIGPRLLISRVLSGQFPNYEMVLPKGNDKAVTFDVAELNQAVKRAALMADDRTRAVRFHLQTGKLSIQSNNAEEGEAHETMAIDYEGEDVEIGFNAQYLQDFLGVAGDGHVVFEFKNGNAQAQFRPAADDSLDYRYVVMPMRV